MSQKQSYAIVPVPATEEMRLAAWLSVGADPIATDEQLAAVLAVAIEAAPPPPEQVLVEADLDSLFDGWHDSPEDINGLIRRVEAAVLAKFKESAE